MKILLFVFGLFCLTGFFEGYGQTPKIDKTIFFTDTSLIKATLITNLDKVLTDRRKKDEDIPGNFITVLPGDIKVNDPILLQVKGDFRLEHCYLPPVKLIFNQTGDSRFYPLKSLRLVCACKTSREYDQYLLKEYIIYKIYNILTDMSFRVRLLELDWKDGAGRRKPILIHAFLREDIKDVAERNQCVEWKKGKISSDAADRRQMTLVSVFEYMIGNTDWAVVANHNIKLISPVHDSLGAPYVVPFDFDFSGFVNAPYAIPDDRLEFKSVRERRYLGYPRNMTEFEEALQIFRLQKGKIYALINQFELLTNKSKTEMIDYLDEFYEIIENPGAVKLNFINNAMPQ